MYYRIIPQSDELLHYGVLGMHWGVRRYQDYDGTRLKGGKTVVKDSLPSRMRNTVAGGQGGKATGNARLAATAGGAKGGAEGKSDEKKSGWLDPTIPHGKGKPNTSPAQEVAKGVRDTARGSKDLVDLAEKHDKSMNDQQKKQAQKAKQMSDQELRDHINRIKMEREYVSLTSKETETGYDKAREVLDVVGDVASVALTLIGIAVAVKKLKQDDMEEGESFDALYDELKHTLEEGDFEEEFIQHAMDLDDEYIDDYLEHHGIKGMKWGVRRFQNYDGTRIGTGHGVSGGGGGSTASKRFRNSIAGGQGGKAKGNARLAASAGGSKKPKTDPRKEELRKVMGDWRPPDSYGSVKVERYDKNGCKISKDGKYVIMDDEEIFISQVQAQVYVNGRIGMDASEVDAYLKDHPDEKEAYSQIIDALMENALSQAIYENGKRG